jgi:hypothetical protein
VIDATPWFDNFVVGAALLLPEGEVADDWSDPPPRKNTRARITTAITPTIAAMVIHGVSPRSLLLLPCLIPGLQKCFMIVNE